jgi:hypothetical protein
MTAKNMRAHPATPAGLSRCASSPVLRPCLTQFGLPSLAQHGQAGVAGGHHDAARPVSGDRARLMSFTLRAKHAIA